VVLAVTVPVEELAPPPDSVVVPVVPLAVPVESRRRRLPPDSAELFPTPVSCHKLRCRMDTPDLLSEFYFFLLLRVASVFVAGLESTEEV
jgi:hypothetical protein